MDWGRRDVTTVAGVCAHSIWAGWTGFAPIKPTVQSVHCFVSGGETWLMLEGGLGLACAGVMGLLWQVYARTASGKAGQVLDR